MHDLDHSLELRMSSASQWLQFLPLVLSIALLAISAWITEANLRLWVQIGGLGALACTPLALLLHRWHPQAGAGFSVLLLVIALWALVVWQDRVELLPLLAIPAGLVAASIGLPVAVVSAMGETLLVLILQGVGPLNRVVSITLIWAAVGLMALAYRPIAEMAEWAMDFYQRALELRQESFERKEVLEQTLHDLANANRQLAMASSRMAGLRTLAEEAQKTKTMFLAKVSHEFRTPLNMIIGLVELMVESPQIYAMELPPDMVKDLEVVLRNCRHLSSMIDDVLDLTRVETGSVTLHRDWVCLSDIIAETVTAVRPLVEKKGLVLDVTIPEDLPEIYCDRARIRQVVLNLVSNAARFTEKGGITIDVDPSGGYVVTRVIDTGPGIAPDDISRIFEPFAQGSANLWHDKGGSGLGLSISQQFVKLHRGRLWVESEVGVGSSFNFKLPILQPVDPIARPGYQIREDWIWREGAFRTERARVAEQVRKPLLIFSDSVGSLYAELMRYTDDVDFVEMRELSSIRESDDQFPADVMLVNRDESEQVVLAMHVVDNLVPSGTLLVQCAMPSTAAKAEMAGAAGHLIKPVTREMLVAAIENLDRAVKRVLIVDDDPDVLRLFERMLRLYDANLEVDTACNPEVGLAKVRCTRYDLVLLDVVMPQMDGWAWLVEIQRDEHLQDLPVYLISAQDPADEPAKTPYLLFSTADGFSVKKLLRCSLEISKLLMMPDGELDPTPQRTAEAG